MPTVTATAIGKWGNSDAVRIPKSVIARAGLRRGDMVNFIVTGPGQITVYREDEHRRVVPAKGVDFNTLFSKYEGDAQAALADQKAAGPAWPDDDLVGAEWDVWS